MSTFTTLVVLAVLFVLSAAQFGPPVGWDQYIIPKDNNMKVCRQWTTSFEQWSDFTNFQVTPYNDGQGSAHLLSTNIARSGKHSHMGVITSIENPEHMGYPSVQLYEYCGGFAGGIYIEIFVWMDISIQTNQWVVIGELSPSVGDTPGARAVSLAIGPDGYLALGNVPIQGYSFWTYQNHNNLFPLQQWVNVTIFISFDPTNGVAAVWQDGTLQSVANVEGGSGLLNQVHFGLFAQNLIPAGVIYNDDLTITEVANINNPCPANSFLYTLPPTNAPASTAAASNGGTPWVNVAIPDSGCQKIMISSGVILAAVLMSLFAYIL